MKKHKNSSLVPSPTPSLSWPGNEATRVARKHVTCDVLGSRRPRERRKLLKGQRNFAYS